jgi:hypothetical protein
MGHRRTIASFVEAEELANQAAGKVNSGGWEVVGRNDQVRAGEIRDRIVKPHVCSVRKTCPKPVVVVDVRVERLIAAKADDTGAHREGVEWGRAICGVLNDISWSPEERRVWKTREEIEGREENCWRRKEVGE